MPERPTRFVVLSARRAGSNMLCTILGAHPDVLCHHELFNPRGVFVALELRGQTPPGDVAARDADPLAFLARAWADDRGRPCVGFKMTLYQQPDVLAAVLADPEVAKLVLRRDDLVQAFVSERIAEALDQWEVYDPRDLVRERPRVHVDPDALRAHAAATRAYYDDVTGRMAASGQPWIELRYEALTELDEQRRAFAFLGVRPPDEPLAPRSVRQNGAPLTALLANHAELVAELRGDPLARYL
jgi:hypothetical protein